LAGYLDELRPLRTPLDLPEESDMPVYIHKVFEQPQPDANLWRYMDLSKYVSMLATGSLWFARMDLLGDPYEG
jgi:hypothetical protein